MSLQIFNHQITKKQVYFLLNTKFLYLQRLNVCLQASFLQTDNGHHNSPVTVVSSSNSL